MRAAKVDSTHSEVRDALRLLGWLVADTARLGGGFPDLLAWHRLAGLHLIEVKSPRGKATPHQRRFEATGWPVTTLRSQSEVLTWSRERTRI